MTNSMLKIFVGSLLFAPVAVAKAEYRETMDPNGLTKHLASDYGLVDDNAQTNQSETLQNAIDNIAAAGGGRLILPKGTYQFSRICLKSNVHLLIEKDTVIRPWWPKVTKTVVFMLGGPEGEDGHIENVSIRGIDGPFVVDYSDRGSVAGEGIRTINCKQVRNFLISDLLVKDSFTTYCAVIFTPAKGEPKKNAIFRPTDGLVRNLKSTDSSPGYGLVQMHAGERIHFENLEAYGGGVAFRLETGAGGHNAGVHDITAKHLYCENGSTAVLLGPHTAQNGMVEIDGVRVKSCAYAIKMGPGFVEQKTKDDATFQSGRFADGTSVRNVHAVFGTNAVIALKGLAYVPEEYRSQLRFDPNDRKTKRVRGPSIGVVVDTTGDSWMPVIENVSSEGFKYNKGIMTFEEKQRANWKDLLKGLPILDDFPEERKQRKKK